MDNELIVPPKKERSLEVFITENGLDPFLQKIAYEVKTFVPDIKTSKGRKAIASLSAKVRSSKALLEKAGKELVAELKKQPKLVDAERKRMRDWCDAKAIEARKPLTDWEDEQNKIKRDQIESERAFAMKKEIEQCHELSLLLNEKRDSQIALEKIAVAKKQEDELKLIKLNAEVEAKSKAKADIDAVIAAKAKVEQDLIDSRDREIAAAKQKIIDEKLADERALKAAQQARQLEIQKQQDRINIEAAAKAKLEKNRSHISKIRREAKESFIAVGFSEDVAKKIVLLISKCHIKNTTINY